MDAPVFNPLDYYTACMQSWSLKSLPVLQRSFYTSGCSLWNSTEFMTGESPTPAEGQEDLKTKAWTRLESCLEAGCWWYIAFEQQKSTPVVF